MEITHVKFMRCLVWQEALETWIKFRKVVTSLIELRILKLHLLLTELKRQYEFLKEPEVEMSKSYQIADYFHEFAERKLRKRSSGHEQVQTVTVATKDVDIAAIREHKCTGSDSQDEFEHQSSIPSTLKKIPNKVKFGQQSSKSDSTSSSTSSLQSAKNTGVKPANRTHELGQPKSASTSASCVPKPKEKHTGTHGFGQESSESGSVSSSHSFVLNEKYTGTKPKIVKRLQKVSVGNIQVPQPPKSSKYAPIVQDKNIDADNKKSSKQIDREKGKFRDTAGKDKICGLIPPPRKKEPILDWRLDDAGANGKAFGGEDEYEEAPTPPPRYRALHHPLDLSIDKQRLEEQPTAPRPPEIDYDIGIVELYTNLHNQLELISKLDQNDADDVDVDTNDMAAKRCVTNLEEWVTLGSHGTKVRMQVITANCNWTVSNSQLIQQLLLCLFTPETLETHNRTGGAVERWEGEMPIPEMPRLDEYVIEDVIEFLSITAGLSQECIENCIDETCNEYFQAKLKRDRQIKKEEKPKSKKKKPKKKTWKKKINEFG